MSLFKKGKLGKKSGDDGAEEGANPDIEAEAEAHAAADAEIGAAEAQAEAGGAQPSAPEATPGESSGMDPAAMPGGGADDLSFDDGSGGDDFDDFDDDYLPQPAASKKKFVVAAVGLVVLAGGSFALMSMMGGSDGPPPPPPPSQQVADTTQPPSQPPATPPRSGDGMPGNDAAPALPMPTPSKNTDSGPGTELAMGGEEDLPPLSAPGMPPAPAGDNANDPLPMPMQMDDESDMDGMDMAEAPDMPMPPMGADSPDDMMSPPDIPGLDDAPDMAEAPDMPGMDDSGMDMAEGPDMPMPPMGADTPDDMMSPPDIPGLGDTPDMDAPDMDTPDMPGMDDDYATPGMNEDPILDDLDSAMEGGLPPEQPSDDAGSEMDAMDADGEKTLAETLGADLAPLEVEDGDAQMPADDDLAALMNAPADDGLGDELDLLEELDQAGPADAGISSAADDVVDTGRTRGRLNLDDLEAEPQLTPIFPRNTSKYLKVEKDYSSSSVRSQVESAQRALKNGRDSLALELFDSLYVKYPRDPRIMMGRAVALQKNGMIEEAVDAYEKVLNRDPRNVNALTNMLGLIRMTDPDRALTKLLDLKATYPGRPSILAQLGMTYADVGDEESALRYLNMAQELEPEDPRHAFNMAVLMDRRGQTPQAIMNYKRALFLNSNVDGNLVPTSAIQQRLDALR